MKTYDIIFRKNFIEYKIKTEFKTTRKTRARYRYASL